MIDLSKFGMPTDIFTNISFDLLLKGASRRYQNDIERAKALSAACQRYTVEKLQYTILLVAEGKEAAALAEYHSLLRFTTASWNLLNKYQETAVNAVKKFSLANLFNWDPFKDRREDTRNFIRDWKLGPDIASKFDVKNYVS